MTMRVFGMTNVGMKRQVNQDSFLIKEYDCGLLAVVCDGMGGASGGEEASSTATAAFSGYIDISLAGATDPGIPLDEWGMGETKDLSGGAANKDRSVRDILLSAVRAANNAVYAAANENDTLSGMGTTLVSAYISGDKVYAVNVGDSRMYIIKDDTITQITHDHSFVQYLVDIGKMTVDEAKTSNNRNIITRAVGTEPVVETDFFTVDADMNGGYVLLCTDGLTNHITEDDMVKCVNEADSPESACASLIEKANLGGGSDNITVVIISM